MNKLLAISIASASIAIGAMPAVAEVDMRIHKLCIEAKDYAGCVRAMKGDTTTTTIREIRSQGADIAEGNQCPAGFAYVGGGNCMEVKCKYSASIIVSQMLKNEHLLNILRSLLSIFALAFFIMVNY